MSRFEVVPYDPSHPDRMLLREYERSNLGCIGDPDGYFKAIAIDNLSWTGMWDGKPAISAGIIPVHPGVGEVWLLFSRRFELEKPSKLWVLAFNAIRVGLERELGMGFHRLQTAIRTDFEPGQRWAERLEFKNEGTMKKYGPDQADYIRYGRVA